MKKTDITDIRRLAGLQQLNENYIYAAEEEEESTEETEEAVIIDIGKQDLIIEHNSNIDCSIYKSLLFSNIRNEVLTDIIIHPEHL
jgi:hypothetical protein